MRDTKKHVLNAMTRNTESAERWKNMVYGVYRMDESKVTYARVKCRMQTSHLSNTRCGPTSALARSLNKCSRAKHIIYVILAKKVQQQATQSVKTKGQLFIYLQQYPFHPPCPAFHSPSSSSSSIPITNLSRIPKTPIPTSTHTIFSERAMRDENIMLTWDHLD